MRSTNARQDVANAQQDAREHIVAKPVTPDQTTDAQQNVADARHDANEKIADAKEREAHAAAELKTTEQQFQETQAQRCFRKAKRAKAGRLR